MTWFKIVVTLFVATVIYRWQKNVDRRTSILAERRTFYREFIEAANKKAITAITSQDRTEKVMSLQEFQTSLEKLHLSAPVSVSKHADKIEKILSELSGPEGATSEVESALKDASRDLVQAMKMDTEETSSLNYAATLGQLVGGLPHFFLKFKEDFVAGYEKPSHQKPEQLSATKDAQLDENSKRTNQSDHS